MRGVSVTHSGDVNYVVVAAAAAAAAVHEYVTTAATAMYKNIIRLRVVTCVPSTE